MGKFRKFLRVVSLDKLYVIKVKVFTESRVETSWSAYQKCIKKRTNKKISKWQMFLGFKVYKISEHKEYGSWTNLKYNKTNGSYY
jgi:hypothetical protein